MHYRRKYPVNTGTIPDTKSGVRRPAEDEAIRKIILSPQFPGAQDGASIEAVRQFIRNQARIKGFRFSGGIGTQAFSLQISGTAKFFLGVQFNESFDADVVLTVNNEVIYQDTPVIALNPFSNPRSDRDWFVVNRPLSGTDEVILLINSFVVYDNIKFTTYYI